MAYNISHLIIDLEAEVLTENFTNERIETGYCCDMLSFVMSRISAHTVWFTILNSMNVIAVASLSGCGCIVLNEDVRMDPDVLLRATSERITVLRTHMSSYEAAARLALALSRA